MPVFPPMIRVLRGMPERGPETHPVKTDLHQEKPTNQRAGVLEYLVWLADENRLVWFRLTEGGYVEIPPAADGSLVSREFPGLVIDAPALTSGDLVAALARLE